MMLSQELADLPGKFQSFVREQQGSNDVQRAFNERTEERLDALQNSLDILVGYAYEMKVADNLRGLLHRRLGLRKAHILKGIYRDEDEEFAGRMEQPRKTVSSPKRNW